MTIGAEDLLKTYGSPLGVAEALLKGELDALEQRYVSEVVGKTILEAAKARLELSRTRHAKALTVERLAQVLFEEFEKDNWDELYPTYFGHLEAADGDEQEIINGLKKVLGRVVDRLNEKNS